MAVWAADHSFTRSPQRGWDALRSGAGSSKAIWPKSYSLRSIAQFVAVVTCLFAMIYNYKQSIAQIAVIFESWSCHTRQNMPLELSLSIDGR
jgi:hypothetical protein